MGFEKDSCRVGVLEFFLCRSRAARASVVNRPQYALDPESSNMKSSLQAQSGAISKKDPVPVELTIAAQWWASRTGDLSIEQANLFRDNLSQKLLEKYRGHWCLENPMRGNAYRYVDERKELISGCSSKLSAFPR